MAWQDLEKGFRESSTEKKGACCVCCCAPFLVGFIILMCSIVSLGPEEQLLITTHGGTGKEVINGPSTQLVSPGKDTEVRKAIRLTPQQYAVVKNIRLGVPRNEEGPMLLFLGAWDELQGVKSKIVLQAREYTRLVNSMTGVARVEMGPKKIVPGVFDVAPKGVQKAYAVKNTQYVVVTNKTSGRKRTARPEGFFIPDPFEDEIKVSNATMLKEKQYAIVRDSLSGAYRHVEGAKLFFPEAYDEVIAIRPKLVLQKQEYVKLIDSFTGYARVVVGPALIVPKPEEDGPGGINHVLKKAIIISSQNFVVLLNRTSGKKYEERTEGMFVPGPYIDILEVRNATVVRSQEYAVLKNDLTGRYVHYAGPQRLFVGAYEKLVYILPKLILQKQEYVRLVDRRTGEEVIRKGPEAIVPEPQQCEKDYTANCVMTVSKAIVMKADVTVLTLNKTSGVKSIQSSSSGGIFTPRPYEDIVEIRQATILKQQDYAVLKNTLSGAFRHVEGPLMLHLDAYDELVRVDQKVVLHKFKYIRLINELTGIERIVEGPRVLVPEVQEVSVAADGTRSKLHNTMILDAVLVDSDHALLMLNQATGVQTLNDTAGMWIPRPYEHFVEMRNLVRVLANEAVIVRAYSGALTVYDGTKGGAGTAFFLPPRSQIVSMSWTVYGEPAADGTSVVSKETVEKIDMRIQRTFYSYTVRTNDNVELMLIGAVFWRVENVTKMMLGTSDPSGDVWHHSRSSFMQAVSNVSFDRFMGTFNSLAKDAYARDIADGFYAERGVLLRSMEVTRFEAVDAETKATLKQINEETTKQITSLKRQEGENAVKAAKMRADNSLAQEQTQAELTLEAAKTNLIRTRESNNLLAKRAEAEAAAQPYAQHAKMFISELKNASVSVTNGLNLYKALQEAALHNKDTENMGKSGATMLLSSQDVGLNFRNLNVGANASAGGFFSTNNNRRLAGLTGIGEQAHDL